MSPQRLSRFLEGHETIGIDTSLFIYQVEAHPKYKELTHSVFTWVEGPTGRAVTSAITLLEVLVQPYRSSDRKRVNLFYSLLSTYPKLAWVEVSLEIADRAAHLRAEYNLRTPDALQAATAIACRATGFISNDAALRRVTGLDVVILDELLQQ